MNDDPRTVEGALVCADQWADLEPQMASVHGATPLITLAAELRRLQAQAKPDTIAQAEAEVVNEAMAKWSYTADEVFERRYGIGLKTACAALAQARKESQGE